MSMKVWRPLDQIDPDSYLYHYTTMEKAYNILIGNELWFSDLTNTNDIFEQKVKISFNEIKNSQSTIKKSSNIIEKIRFVRKYMNDSRSKIKMLCFSRDSVFESDEERNAFKKLQNQLPFEINAVNVIGRGFSLPRMWSQYAENNKGVCFIFDKKKILEKVKSSGHANMYQNVEYSPLYCPYTMSLVEFNDTFDLINKQCQDALRAMIENKNKYLLYDLFYKLSDWESENEFRIIVTLNNGEDKVKLKHINDSIKGIVYGANTDMVNSKIIKLLASEYDVRKLIYEDVITKIICDK